MTRLGKAVLAAVAVALAAAAEKARFEPRPAETYPARQTADGVTIAVEPYDTGDKIKQAFGKANPTKVGVLPILIVINNDSDRVLQLEGMRVQLITADRQKIAPTPPKDVYRAPVQRPDITPPPSPIPGVKLGRKSPETPWEVEARAFVAPMVPARSAVHGFFYFRLGAHSSRARTTVDRITGSNVYITGIRDARTGQDLLYFEISLEPYGKPKRNPG